MAFGFGKSTTGRNDIIKSLQQSYIVDDELLYLQRIIQENDLVIDGVCTKRKMDWVAS